MPWVALNLSGPAVFHRDENAASVRAIVRTRGMDDLLHDSFDYRVLRENIGGGKKKTGGLARAARQIIH